VISNQQVKRAAEPGPHAAAESAARGSVAAMLQASSIALVGASARPGSFGQSMVDEVTKSPAGPRVHLVNPRYTEIGGRPCVPSLAELPDPVDLVLLAVPDAVLADQLSLAAARGDRSAVIFGGAYADASGTDLRERLAATARTAGMALCGAGCMGFVNLSHGLRVIGYAEPDPLRAGPVALLTHSGSVFSSMLRSRRAIGYTIAVSSGQELVTAAPAYLEYALGLPDTKVLALVLEAMRQPDRLRQVLASAAARDIPVVLLTAGSSASGRMMVAAHSGALAGADGGWEALTRGYGLHRVGDLAEFADTVEMFAIGRRVRGGSAQAGRRRAGIATVHDSGLERAHAADVAEQLGVPFGEISQATRARLSRILDPGLVPDNPLDVWGNGRDVRAQFGASLTALAADESVAAVALAVDLSPELDRDPAYPDAVLDTAARTDKPIVVVSNLSGVIDIEQAARLRGAGIPVLESLRSGLRALRHLLDHADRSRLPAALTTTSDPAPPADRPAVGSLDGGASGAAPPGGPRPPESGSAPPIGRPPPAGDGGPSPGTHVSNGGRRDRAARLLAAGQRGGAPLLALLREYGIATVRAEPAADLEAAAAAAASIGYPGVLKTDEPGIGHKSDVGGVIIGVGDQTQLAAGYADLAERLGRRVLVCATAAPGVELSLGVARDPDLGPLLVLGAGGVLVELLGQRVVALPPVDEQAATRLLAELPAARLLDGARGAPPADRAAVARAITCLSVLASELGEQLDGFDINPLICGPGGAIAVDALVIPRRPAT
jgi:acyl-CoA synthetase (NDP forming)